MMEFSKSTWKGDWMSMWSSSTGLWNSIETPSDSVWSELEQTVLNMRLVMSLFSSMRTASVERTGLSLCWLASLMIGTWPLSFGFPYHYIKYFTHSLFQTIFVEFISIIFIICFICLIWLVSLKGNSEFHWETRTIYTHLNWIVWFHCNQQIMHWCCEGKITLSIDPTRSIIEDEEDILDGLEQTKVVEIRYIMYILDWLIDHDWFTILWY